VPWNTSINGYTVPLPFYPLPFLQQSNCGKGSLNTFFLVIAIY